MNKYDEILDFLDEVQEALTQFLSSGFSTSHEYTLNTLKELGKNAECLGLTYASEKLDLLYKRFNLKRHNFEFDFTSITEEFLKLNEYCMICRKQLDLIKTKELMENN